MFFRHFTGNPGMFTITLIPFSWYSHRSPPCRSVFSGNFIIWFKQRYFLAGHFFNGNIFYRITHKNPDKIFTLSKKFAATTVGGTLENNARGKQIKDFINSGYESYCQD